MISSPKTNIVFSLKCPNIEWSDEQLRDFIFLSLQTGKLDDDLVNPNTNSGRSYHFIILWSLRRNAEIFGYHFLPQYVVHIQMKNHIILELNKTTTFGFHHIFFLSPSDYFRNILSRSSTQHDLSTSFQCHKKKIHNI